jgi:hypothetical protein
LADEQDWEKELAKIDRQIGSMTDSQLSAAGMAQNQPAALPARTAVGDASGSGRSVAPLKPAGKLAVYVRLGLSLGLAVGILFWPYGSRCGWGLAGYLLVAALTTATALWSAVHTWKARMPVAHVISLLLALWGGLIGAREILPRTGYAVPTVERPSGWVCS